MARSKIAEQSTPVPRASQQAASGGASTAWPWAGLAVLLVVVAAYANTFTGEFLWDDVTEIEQNPAFRTLWPPTQAMFAGGNLPHRPIPYYSFALNYALGGTDVTGYHIVNLAIHLVCGWILFDLVRRVLRLPVFGDRYAQSAPWLALAAAAIWLAHPLQTQAVAYIYQRIESLMALCYLATLDAFLIAQSSKRPRLFLALSVACCALGMASKEVMATAPLVVLGLDWLFVEHDLRRIARRRWPYYTGLALTWLLLGGLVAAEAARYSELAAADGPTPAAAPADASSDAAKPDVAGLSAAVLPYARTQPEVLWHYFGLVVWPAGQCLDWKWPVQDDPRKIALAAIALLAVVGLGAACARRSPRFLFLIAACFLVLAPTSSVLPVADVCMEHRMYLPLAAVAVAVVVAFYEAARWWSEREGGSPQVCSRLFLSLAALAALLVVLLAATTFARNEVFRSREAMWRDVIAKAPWNGRAYASLAKVYLDRNDDARAVALCREALERSPTQPAALANIAVALSHLGRRDEAIDYARRAVAVRPHSAEARYNLARLLIERDPAAAREQLEAAIQLAPRLAAAHNALGVLLEDRDPQAALAHYRAAVAADPRDPVARRNLRELAERLGKGQPWPGAVPSP